MTATPATQVPAPGLDIPEGFETGNFGGGYIAANGPLYLKKLPQGVLLGFRVEARHCNPMGYCHGGMLSTFCDMLLPISAHHTVPELTQRFLPTISLQVDYLASAPLGAWVQGQAQVLRHTRSLVFMQGLVSIDGQTIARTSGVFKIGPPFEDALGPLPTPPKA